MRISDWSSDVCSSDLHAEVFKVRRTGICRGIRGLRTQLAAQLDVVGRQRLQPGIVTGKGRRRCAEAADQRERRRRAAPRAQLTTNLSNGDAVVPDTISSDDRRVGEEGVSTCNARWTPDNSKKKNE